MVLKNKGIMHAGAFVGCSHSDNSTGLDKKLSASGIFKRRRKYQERSKEDKASNGCAIKQAITEGNRSLISWGNWGKVQKTLFLPTHPSGLSWSNPPKEQGAGIFIHPLPRVISRVLPKEGVLNPWYSGLPLTGSWNSGNSGSDTHTGSWKLARAQGKGRKVKHVCWTYFTSFD